MTLFLIDFDHDCGNVISISRCYLLQSVNRFVNLGVTQSVGKIVLLQEVYKVRFVVHVELFTRKRF